MADLYMDVDAALAEVPVNILPLLDDTDFKSIEGAVAFNASGMALRWHFVTPAGAYTVTSVTPTSAGDYDWTDQGDSGVYTIEIPASGGASINNDTEGFGWFTGVATGILPWRGPVICFRAAGLNDKLIESAYSATRGLAGTALPDAAADAAGGLVISDAGGLDIDDLKADINTIDDFLDTEIAAIKAKTDNLPSDPADASDIAGAFSTLSGKVDTIDDFLDTEVAAIKAKTDNLPSDPADASDIAGLLSTLSGKIDTIDDFLDTEIAAIKAVTDLFTAAQAEPTAVPAANATPMAKIAWLAMIARNKITQSATENKIFADDASTVVGTAATSDSGTVATRGEFA